MSSRLDEIIRRRRIRVRPISPETPDGQVLEALAREHPALAPKLGRPHDYLVLGLGWCDLILVVFVDDDGEAAALVLPQTLALVRDAEVGARKRRGVTWRGPEVTPNDGEGPYCCPAGAGCCTSGAGVPPNQPPA